MKKLNKQQKELIKKNIFKVLHIIGYICTAITIITAIAIGVNSCNNDDSQNTYVSLNEKSINRSVDYNELGYSKL